MEFEFNAEKSASNKTKHGIDFVEAQALWRDENLYVSAVVAAGELRYLVVGLIDGKLWTAIMTWREDRARIISVRPARHVERQRYEGNYS
jgi:uncharacterized DUF497 family protein